MLRIVTAIWVAALAGCAATERSPYSQGGTYEGAFEIGRHQVPLPDGEWHFVAHNLYRNRQGDAFADVQLVRFDAQQRVLTGGVLISANINPLQQMTPRASFCEQNAVYHKAVINSRPGSNQDCWVVSYFRSSIGRQTDKVSTQTLAYLLNHRIRFPNFAVYTAYRLASESDHLTVQYYFNPEHETRIAAAPRVSWRQSPWHLDHYGADPEKVAYIEKLKLWSGEWYDQVKLGFALR